MSSDLTEEALSRESLLASSSLSAFTCRGWGTQHSDCNINNNVIWPDGSCVASLLFCTRAADTAPMRRGFLGVGHVQCPGVGYKQTVCGFCVHAHAPAPHPLKTRLVVQRRLVPHGCRQLLLQCLQLLLHAAHLRCQRVALLGRAAISLPGRVYDIIMRQIG